MKNRDDRGRFIKGGQSPRYQNLMKYCIICKKEFKTIQSQYNNRQYCSAKCKNIAMKAIPKESQPAWKTGFSISKQGYMRQRTNEKNYQYAHRLVIEQKIGRKLLRNETIHHIDGNKLNNNINNLEIIIRQKRHPASEIRCPHCLKTFFYWQLNTQFSSYFTHLITFTFPTLNVNRISDPIISAFPTFVHYHSHIFCDPPGRVFRILPAPLFQLRLIDLLLFGSCHNSV